MVKKMVAFQLAFCQGYRYDIVHNPLNYQAVAVLSSKDSKKVRCPTNSKVQYQYYSNDVSGAYVSTMYVDLTFISDTRLMVRLRM